MLPKLKMKFVRPHQKRYELRKEKLKLELSFCRYRRF